MGEDKKRVNRYVWTMTNMYATLFTKIEELAAKGREVDAADLYESFHDEDGNLKVDFEITPDKDINNQKINMGLRFIEIERALDDLKKYDKEVNEDLNIEANE